MGLGPLEGSKQKEKRDVKKPFLICQTNKYPGQYVKKESNCSGECL